MTTMLNQVAEAMSEEASEDRRKKASGSLTYFLSKFTEVEEDQRVSDCQGVGLMLQGKDMVPSIVQTANTDKKGLINKV